MNFSTGTLKDSFLLCHKTPQYNAWLIFPSGIVLQLHGVSYLLLFGANGGCSVDPASACSVCRTDACKHQGSIRLITVRFCVISASSSAETHSDWVTLRYTMLNSPFQNHPGMEKMIQLEGICPVSTLLS